MDPSLLSLAADQHGVLTRRQLRAAGASLTELRWARDSERLTEVHPGVYAVGPVLSQLGEELAAVLACGRGAALSHRSAAFRWGLLRYPPAIVDATISRTTPAGLDGVDVHRSRRPPAVTSREGIPVTDVRRTLLDLADVVDYEVLHKAAFDAEHAGLVRLGDLRPIPGRRGNQRLRRLFEHTRERTRSELEKRVLGIVRKAGLPEPVRNVKVGRHTVDLAWPEQRLGLEADGWEWHASRAAFDADRARDLELEALGWRVLRVTWTQLDERPALLVDALIAVGARSAPPRRRATGARSAPPRREGDARGRSEAGLGL